MTPADVAAAITSTASPATGLSPIAQPVGESQGVVISLQPGLPFNTVTVTVAGDPTQIPGVRYATSYSPSVGDTVVFNHVGDMLVIAYALSGGSGSSGGGVDIGDCIWTPIQKTSNPNWLLCDGSAVNATTYPALHAINANTPDLMHYLPAGTGLVAAGATAGATTHALTLAELAAHDHSHAHVGGAHAHTISNSFTAGTAVPQGGAYLGTAGSANSTNSGGAVSTDTDTTSVGSGTAHSILNPVRGGYWYQRAL
jgi:hypothetical protein